MKKVIKVIYEIDEEDEIQDFLGKVFDREAEVAVGKAWKKVYSKYAQEELEARGIAIPEPCVVFDEDGSTVRIATTEDDGRDTAVDAPDDDFTIEADKDKGLTYE
jgi:hypothetical protein